MTTYPRGVLPLMAAGLLACASVKPAPPQHQGPTWLRAESEHFILYTDQAESAARDTILTYERLLDAYRQLGSQTVVLPMKLEAVVFDQISDFAALSNDPRGFQVRAAPFEPMVVMPYIAGADSWAILKHELTHSVAYQSLPVQPPWFAEGVAVYFQTAYFAPEQQLIVGEPPRDLQRVLLKEGHEPASKLLSAESAELRPRFYASAWLLVHYLMSEHADGFVKLREAFREGLTREAAWAQAFPELPLAHVDQALDAYIAKGDFAFRAQPAQPYTGVAPRVDALSDADVHALRARVLLSCPSCGWEQFRDSTEHVEQALQQNPKHLAASLLRIPRLPADERLPAARALAKAHPDAWQAWALIALGEQRDPLRGGRCSAEVRTRLGELGESSAYALMLSA
ncbi:MAG TPA: hypothetical protein VJR89_20805, partial [Polyangiales bacterium]|nr:hypothetical protein [Polyangiales bacterium]